MAFRWGPRVLETSTTTGTGTYTLAGAVTGYQTFANGGLTNNDVCYYAAWEVDASGVPSGGWEEGLGTWATGGTLARTQIFKSSNSDAAVNWAAGTRRLALVDPSINMSRRNFVAGGRLTLTSATPVTTSDVTAAGTLYYVPYTGNEIALFDGQAWRTYTITAELSLSLTLTSGKNYDVFIYDNAGTLTLELSAAWTNDTTRADAIALQNFIYVKSGATTRRHVGTIRASGANTVDDSGFPAAGTTPKRFVWNRYNQVFRPMRAIENADSWTYTTGTFRSANADDTNRLEYVVGDAATLVECQANSLTSNSGSAANAATGVGVDSTSANSATIFPQTNITTLALPSFAKYMGYPGLGYHYLQWLEYSSGGGGTMTWFGDAGVTYLQTGIFGGVWG